MGIYEVINDAHSGRDWVIFVVHIVKDRPSRNSYQRLLALGSEFNVLVITSAALPPMIDREVQGVFVASGHREVWSMALKAGQGLKSEGKKFYIHTQYSTVQALAGYICKRKLGCKWIYDLWDHPSLNYSMRRGLGRWARQLIEGVVTRYVLIKADAWVIAMHPAVLGHMPPAPSTCRLIFTQPGILAQEKSATDLKERDLKVRESVRILYVGPIAQQRLKVISTWVRDYSGAKIDLQFVGPLARGGKEVLDEIAQFCAENYRMSYKYHGEIAHTKVLEIIERSDIGICPLDTSVLNYRFAYPIKVVEQMHLGLIVVATETHGVRAYVRDGLNGVLIQSQSDGVRKAFDRAIGMVTDATQADRVTEAAAEIVQHDTWPNKNKRLVGLIKEVVGPF